MDEPMHEDMRPDIDSTLPVEVVWRDASRSRGIASFPDVVRHLNAIIAVLSQMIEGKRSDSHTELGVLYRWLFQVVGTSRAGSTAQALSYLHDALTRIEGRQLLLATARECLEGYLASM